MSPDGKTLHDVQADGRWQVQWKECLINPPLFWKNPWVISDIQHSILIVSATAFPNTLQVVFSFWAIFSPSQTILTSVLTCVERPNWFSRRTALLAARKPPCRDLSGETSNSFIRTSVRAFTRASTLRLSKTSILTIFRRMMAVASFLHYKHTRNTLNFEHEWKYTLYIHA
jgi:hypothetical protein